MRSTWRSMVDYVAGSTEAPRPGPPDSVEPDFHEAIAHEPPPAEPTRPTALDLLGQQNETIRSQIGRIGDRLGEIALLKQDFTALHESVASIIIEYPQLQAQLVERDALLRQERENTTRLDRYQRGLAASNARLNEEVGELAAQVSALKDSLKERDGELNNHRSELRDRKAFIADLEKELANESARARIVSDDNQAFRHEIQEADKAIVRLERDLAEVRDTLSVVQNDHQTLRVVADDQAGRLASLSRNHSDIEQQLEATRHHAAELETKLAAETAAAQKLEAERDSDRAQLRTALAAEEVKVEGMRSRIRMTENILEQAREQLRARAEQLKSAERALRDATLDKQSAERKYQTVQQDLSRESSNAGDLEKARLMLADRCDMLTKALAAKDNALNTAEAKIESLNGRIDELGQQGDAARTSYEVQIRKVVEELTSERSDRALAQGALESARQSRSELERELTQMRKGFGEVRKLSEELIADRVQRQAPAAESEPETPSNVRPFRNPD